MEALLIAAIAFAVALAATPGAAHLARRLGVLDRPGDLKVQAQPVPYLGGVAIFVPLLVVLAPSHPAWLFPLTGALALGIADDVVGVSAKVRLGCEIVIGAAAGAVAPASGRLGGLATAVAVVGLINAVNLLDGLDGLASSVAFVSAAGFALLGGTGRSPAAALAGALAGFLVFNRPPARIYLGDGGAYLIGAALAMFAGSALHHEPEFVYWLVVPLLVAVPLTDTAIAIVRRLRARRPLFAGDRSHVYDQLVDRGRSRVQATLACAGAQLLLAAVAVSAWNMPHTVAIAFVGVVVAAVTASVLVLGFAAPNRES